MPDLAKKIVELRMWYLYDQRYRHGALLGIASIALLSNIRMYGRRLGADWNEAINTYASPGVPRFGHSGDGQMYKYVMIIIERDRFQMLKCMVAHHFFWISPSSAYAGQNTQKVEVGCLM